jgi:hypothetical protein
MIKIKWGNGRKAKMPVDSNAVELGRSRNKKSPRKSYEIRL